MVLWGSGVALYGRTVIESGFRPTPRAADTASPWARRGGWSGEVASPAVVVGRLRRAADAIVGRRRQGSAGGGQAKARVKGQEKRLGKAQVALRLCGRKGQRGWRSGKYLEKPGAGRPRRKGYLIYG